MKSFAVVAMVCDAHTHTDRQTHTHTHVCLHAYALVHTYTQHTPAPTSCYVLFTRRCIGMHGTCSFARNPCPDVMSVHAENLSHVLTAHGSLLVLRCHVNFGMISQEMKIQTCCRQTDTTLIFFCAAVCVCLCVYLHVCCACCDYRV